MTFDEFKIEHKGTVKENPKCPRCGQCSHEDGKLCSYCVQELQMEYQTQLQIVEVEND